MREQQRPAQAHRAHRGAQVNLRGNEVTIEGEEAATDDGQERARAALRPRARGQARCRRTTSCARSSSSRATPPRASIQGVFGETILTPRAGRPIAPKGAEQKNTSTSIRDERHHVRVGPAGTGKTYLAVALAVRALLDKQVRRIILTRPAVEAGERLGFLPGTLEEKVDPYLRPLYDALHDMIDADKLERFMADGTIEIAPLAFMRGRAQPTDAKVMTLDGWREIGSLKVGDQVMGSDGFPTKVTGVFPQGVKDAYRVTMTDGTSTRCCAEHLWAVRTPSDKRGTRLRASSRPAR